MEHRHPRPGREHRAIAEEAGLGRLSLVSVLAGLITAYGAFAIVAAIVGAILRSADVDTEFRTNDWTGSGAAASLATAVALLIAYLFGGYVAGRMARRSGVLHGVAVFVASLLVGLVVGGIVAGLTDDAEIRSNLRSIGVPTEWDQITGVAATGAIVSILAILVGAVAGGILGERWHTELARRADDPQVGPAAESRRRAELEDRERERRIERDGVIARERHRVVDVRDDRDAGEQRPAGAPLETDRDQRIS